MAKEYSTLEELYEEASNRDFIVGNEKKSKSLHFLDTITLCPSLAFTTI